jgi:glycosyltransferase involved in cell wall biosynthesis
MISIIIPHLPERDISETLKSIKEQTINDYEIIVITDDIRKGACWCRNRGFEKSKGEYLFFCDDDVILAPNCLYKMKQILDTMEDISFVYCNFELIGDINNKVKGKRFNINKLKEFNYINTMSMIRRFVFPMFDESLERLQDWDLWLTIIDKNYKGYWVDEQLFVSKTDNKGISLRSRDDF